MSNMATHPFPAQGRCHIAHTRRACPPSSEITSRIKVCVAFVTTLFALELRLLGPVLAFGMPTLRTGLRGMPGVFFCDPNACESSLVANHVQKLGKRPGVDHPVDFPGTFGPVPDAEQFFHVQDAPASATIFTISRLTLWFWPVTHLDSFPLERLTLPIFRFF